MNHGERAEISRAFSASVLPGTRAFWKLCGRHAADASESTVRRFSRMSLLYPFVYTGSRGTGKRLSVGGWLRRRGVSEKRILPIVRGNGDAAVTDLKRAFELAVSGVRNASAGRLNDVRALTLLYFWDFSPDGDPWNNRKYALRREWYEEDFHMTQAKRKESVDVDEDAERQE